MSQEQPTTERVKEILSRISAWYRAAEEIENRLMTADVPNPMAYRDMVYRDIEWTRRQVAMYDERMQRARDLEAQLEDALAPVGEAILALVKEGT